MSAGGGSWFGSPLTSPPPMVAMLRMRRGGDPSHGRGQQGDTLTEQRVVFQPPQGAEGADAQSVASFFDSTQSVGLAQ